MLHFKPPLDYSWVTYLYVFVLSFIGGTASYIIKVKEGVAKRFSIAELIGDNFVAGFIGLITFFLCEYFGVDQRLSAVFIGISAHNSSRAIFLLSEYIQHKVYPKEFLEELEKQRKHFKETINGKK